MPLNDPLLDGFRRFQQQYFSAESDLFADLRHGQHPATLVIACCDSRVHPASLMGSQPGEMLVVRNVANLVPPNAQSSQHASVAAALEFAVLNLQIERIIVMGHAGCGGIRALMQKSTPDDSALTRWLDIAAPARDLVYRHHKAEDESSRLRRCEQASILVSLNNLLTYPWLADKVKSGKLTINGWYFDLNDGTLWGYDTASSQFTALVCPLPQ